jgi:hypothetical protein
VTVRARCYRTDQTRAGAETDFIASPELSAEEQSVVVFLQRTGDNDIWVIERARNLARRLADGPPADAHPRRDPTGSTWSSLPGDSAAVVRRGRR